MKQLTKGHRPLQQPYLLIDTVPLLGIQILYHRYVYRYCTTVALLGMVAPGRNFVVSPLFGPKTSDDKKKVIAVKVMGFFSPEICDIQNQKKSLPLNWLVFSSNEDGKRIFTINQWRYGFTS